MILPRSIHVYVSACLLVLMDSALVAQARVQGVDDTGKRKVSLSIENLLLGEALQVLFHQAGGVKYRVNRDIDLTSAHLSLGMSEVSLEVALNALLRAGRASGQRLTYTVEDGVYTITRDERATAAQRSGVSITVTDTDLREVLENVFRQAGVKCEIDKAVKGTVTVSLQNVPLLDTGLSRIVRAARSDVPLTFRAEKGTYQVLTVTDPRVQADVNTEPCTQKFSGIDLREALKTLFTSVKANYVLDQAVRGKVTCDLQKAPFRSALEQLLSNSETPLTWRIENRVYVVLPSPKGSPRK